MSKRDWILDLMDWCEAQTPPRKYEKHKFPDGHIGVRVWSKDGRSVEKFHPDCRPHDEPDVRSALRRTQVDWDRVFRTPPRELKQTQQIVSKESLVTSKTEQPAPLAPLEAIATDVRAITDALARIEGNVERLRGQAARMETLAKVLRELGIGEAAK